MHYETLPKRTTAQNEQATYCLYFSRRTAACIRNLLLDISSQAPRASPLAPTAAAAVAAALRVRPAAPVLPGLTRFLLPLQGLSSAIRSPCSAAALETKRERQKRPSQALPLHWPQSSPAGVKWRHCDGHIGVSERHEHTCYSSAGEAQTEACRSLGCCKKALPDPGLDRGRSWQPRLSNACVLCSLCCASEGSSDSSDGNPKSTGFRKARSWHKQNPECQTTCYVYVHTSSPNICP